MEEEEEGEEAISQGQQAERLVFEHPPLEHTACVLSTLSCGSRR